MEKGNPFVRKRFNITNHKIINLGDPIDDKNAVNWQYLEQSHIKPTHKTDQFKYFTQNKLEWTGSFNMVKIADLLQHDGNPHTYNHKVIYANLNKNSHGNFNYKLWIQCFTLQKDEDYTLCIEFLNTDYQLWHKNVSADRTTSQWLTIGNEMLIKNLVTDIQHPQGR